MSEEESIAPEGYEQKSSSDKLNQQSNEQEGEPKEPLPQPERQPLPIAIGTQPENMETHAHHLHKAPGKKLWHYLFEFLMCFSPCFADSLQKIFVSTR